MKKVLLFIVVAFIFIACNKSAESKSNQSDSIVTEEAISSPTDSLHGDSIANVDSVAPVM